jgi:hypothetical protein
VWKVKYYLTYIILLTVIGIGVFTYVGWKVWIRSRLDVSERGWRGGVTFTALMLLSLLGLLFIGYATYNMASQGTHSGGNATILLFLRAGNYLSLITVIVSLGAKGKGRWAALLGGCLFLVFWLAQGMGL